MSTVGRGRDITDGSKVCRARKYRLWWFHVYELPIKMLFQ